MQLPQTCVIITGIKNIIGATIIVHHLLSVSIILIVYTVLLPFKLMKRKEQTFPGEKWGKYQQTFPGENEENISKIQTFSKTVKRSYNILSCKPLCFCQYKVEYFGRCKEMFKLPGMICLIEKCGWSSL